jgi:hypothetical protein
MKFLIQKINGKIVHDFSFTLIESINYQNWFNNGKDKIKFVFINTMFDEAYAEPIKFKSYHKNYIPIGRIDFVFEYLKYFGYSLPKPINIPSALFYDYFLSRKISFGNKQNIQNFPCFVKSDTTIKKFTEIIYDASELSIVPENDKYLISEVIDILSEWRCFVFEGKLVGLQNYSGDFTLFPDVKLINEMISEYKEAPIAYTLDVGVNKLNTFVIECHDFYSVGSYGFANHKILPQMFYKWFINYKNNIN